MTQQDGAEHHVVAALLRRGEKVLLCHRSPSRSSYPDAWDLPGGHVEGAELPHQALVRELQEELDIRVASLAGPIAHVQATDYRMDIWLIDKWSGEPTNADPGEHDALAWFDLDRARRLKLADPRLLGLIALALG